MIYLICVITEIRKRIKEQGTKSKDKRNQHMSISDVVSLASRTLATG